MIDLARYWKAQTGLPCIFAVWVARKDWFKENKAIALQLSQQLNNQAAAFKNKLSYQREILQRIETLAPQLHQQIGTNGVKEYLLTALSYNLDEDTQAALSILKQICQEHDDKPPKVTETQIRKAPTPQRAGLVPA